jgi:Contractile injection system tube protein
MKASLIPEDGSRKLTFHFNPKEYSVSKSATWTRPTTKGATNTTKPEFTGSNPRTVQMEIFFDDWEHEGHLVKDIETLLNWMTPTSKSVKKNVPEPKVLRFQWGGDSAPLAEFKGFLKSCNAKFTLFKPEGIPVRATATISLEEIPTVPAKTNPTSGSLAGRSVHLVTAGDTLHSIAFREYDNPALWRGLAAFNQIDDPLRLKVGARLLIPTIDEAAGQS